MAVQMELTRIIIAETSDQQFIFLKEKDGSRTLPIVIGSAEAIAIDNRLKGTKFPRPQTHELLSNVIDKMGGKLERIVINDLQEHTFFAQLIIRRDGQRMEIDSRPSDAIAIGIAENIPIFVAEHVLDQVTGDTPG